MSAFESAIFWIATAGFLSIGMIGLHKLTFMVTQDVMRFLQRRSQR